MTCQGETTWQEQVRVAPTTLPRTEFESNVSLLTANLVVRLLRCARKEPRVRHTHTHTHTHTHSRQKTYGSRNQGEIPAQPCFTCIMTQRHLEKNAGVHKVG